MCMIEESCGDKIVLCEPRRSESSQVACLNVRQMADYFVYGVEVDQRAFVSGGKQLTCVAPMRK